MNKQFDFSKYMDKHKEDTIASMSHQPEMVFWSNKFKLSFGELYEVIYEGKTFVWYNVIYHYNDITGNIEPNFFKIDAQ